MAEQPTATRSTSRRSGEPRPMMRNLSSFASGSKIYADSLHETLVEGDIILFKGHKASDNCIRCCTRADYNHVGLIVENGGELEIFESSPGATQRLEHSYHYCLPHGGCAHTSCIQTLVCTAGVECVPLNFYIDS